MNSRDYMAEVRRLGCVLCKHLGLGETPADAHHAFDTAARSDWLTVALCREHHQGASGFHGLGQKAFERRYKLTEADLLAMTIKGLHS